MSYILVPSNNSNRNDNELRLTIDGGLAYRDAINRVKDKMSQMNDTEVQAYYNLGSTQDAIDLKALVTSAADEIKSAVAVPFTTQLFERVS